jgi:hypothetical protein
MKFKNLLENETEVRVGFYKTTDGKPYFGTIPGLEVDIKDQETKELRDDSYEHVKIRVWKKDGLGLPVIIEPGANYNMTDDYYIKWSESRGHFLEKAELIDTTEKIVEEKVKIYQFFDLRNFNTEVKRKVKTTFQTAFSKSSLSSKTHAEGSEFSIGGKVGGWLGNKKEGNKGANGEISVGFKSKVENSFTQKYENSITRIWSQSVEDEYSLKPGKIYALTSIWNIKYTIGEIAYFGEKTSYKVLTSSESRLTTPVAYNSEAEMDQNTREMYNKQLELNAVLQ